MQTRLIDDDELLSGDSSIDALPMELLKQIDSWSQGRHEIALP